MELSEKIDAKEESNIVQETLSQIASEEMKVDTSDMDGVRAAVDSFYAYDKKPVKKKKKKTPSGEEKIIIKSDELKHKRKSSGKSAPRHEAVSSKKKKSSRRSWIS